MSGQIRLEACVSVCTAEEQRWTDRLTDQQPNVTHSQKQKAGDWAISPVMGGLMVLPPLILCSS